jgi:hypothetical protein
MATVSIENDGCTSRTTIHGDRWCTFSRTQDEQGFGQTETAEDVNPPQSVSPQAHAPHLYIVLETEMSRRMPHGRASFLTSLAHRAQTQI